MGSNTTIITGNFSVNDIVYHVDLDDGVREGVVRSQSIEINPTSTNITYDIGYTLPTIGCSGSSSDAAEADLWSDIDDALADYKTRIESA